MVEQHKRMNEQLFLFSRRYRESKIITCFAFVKVCLAHNIRTINAKQTTLVFTMPIKWYNDIYIGPLK